MKTCKGCKARIWSGRNDKDFYCGIGFKTDNDIPLEKCPKPKSEISLYEAQNEYWKKRNNKNKEG